MNTITNTIARTGILALAIFVLAVFAVAPLAHAADMPEGGGGYWQPISDTPVYDNFSTGGGYWQPISDTRVYDFGSQTGFDSGFGGGFSSSGFGSSGFGGFGGFGGGGFGGGGSMYGPTNTPVPNKRNH